MLVTTFNSQGNIDFFEVVEVFTERALSWMRCDPLLLMCEVHLSEPFEVPFVTFLS